MADEILEAIAHYVVHPPSFSEEAYRTARYCLADALGCAVLALQYPACTKLLGPTVPEIHVTNGTPIPATPYVLDPVNAAFSLGTMIRWLDFNDTWLAAEWGHPSDNIGGLLPLCDFLSRQNINEGKDPFTVRELLTAIIKAYEIQGGLALLNSYNRIGFDHVALVKIATTAVATHLLGGSYEHVLNAVSQALIDTGSLRTYRHAPNVGSRKSWAAGDATSRGVWLALMTMRGEKGYDTALTAPKWGLYDVLFKGKPFALQRPFSCYVMENVLFKISFPAEFHAQTAVEAAFKLFSVVKDRLNDIRKITIRTHDSAIRIIDKKGPLRNPADRDHCLQYMVAIGLLKGTLTANDYEDEAAKNPLIDQLREKMHVIEEPIYSDDYHHPEKRSIANAIRVEFIDGSSTEEVTVEYPLGHRRRRSEGIPRLMEKLQNNLTTHYTDARSKELCALFEQGDVLENMAVPTFVNSFSM